MSDQDNGQVSTLQRPISDDPEAWKAYWKAQGWPWRTEPEIDAERQQELEKRLTIISEEREKAEDEILFFKDIQLSRADMEWLLATHKKIDRIIIIKYPTERRQKLESLNLSGADLRNVDLTGLSMERISLKGAHLEGANLTGTHLEGALLIKAHLEGANLVGVHLEGAYLGEAHLERV